MKKKETIQLIIVICSLFLLLGTWVVVSIVNSNDMETEIIENGKRVVGFYERSGYNSFSPSYYYLFSTESSGHECVSGIKVIKDQRYGLNEIPVLIGYLKDNPSQSILIEEEEFSYKGYKILYKEDNSYFRMQIISFSR